MDPTYVGHEPVSQGKTTPFALRRLGIIMRPRPGDPLEAGGVLNPAGARGIDGAYYLFPRMVAARNYSRIGIARIEFDEQGIPREAERLGIALEPSEPYELNKITGGGCEDPRVAYVPALGAYVMTYVAFGPHGPRAAVAVSPDLFSWTRRGLIDFAPRGGVDMNLYGNKDAMVFPEPVPDPAGRPSVALLHRPMYEAWDDGASELVRITMPPPGIAESRWSMWISYCPLEDAGWARTDGAPTAAPRFDHHELLIAPHFSWEALRIGGGTPPIRLGSDWLTYYHGIEALPGTGTGARLCYSAGALLLDGRDPRHLVYRSPEPTLTPELPEERSGVVSNVVFPTAVDQREKYLDVYYGMADAAIGVARLDLPSA